MKQHNPLGIAAPIKDWTHADLVTWMSWEIVRGITSGRALEETIFNFPQIILDWSNKRKEGK